MSLVGWEPPFKGLTVVTLTISTTATAQFISASCPRTHFSVASASGKGSHTKRRLQGLGNGPHSVLVPKDPGQQALSAEQARPGHEVGCGKSMEAFFSDLEQV